MSQERRHKTRVGFNTRVNLTVGETAISTQGNSKDISREGMFLQTDEKIEVGRACKVEIVLSGSADEISIKIQGKIARHESNGLGITFDAVDIDSYEHFHNLLVYNAEDPDAVEQELTPVTDLPADNEQTAFE